jgi:hypothetical protein
MTDHRNGYRDELAAAHARIAELEEQVEVLARRTEAVADKATPEQIETRLRDLGERREHVRKSRRTHSWLLLPIVAMLLVGSATYLFNLPLLLTLLLILPTFVVLRKWVRGRDQHRASIVALDQEIAKLTSATAPEPLRTRIAVSPPSPSIEMVDADDVDSTEAPRKRSVE